MQLVVRCVRFQRKVKVHTLTDSQVPLPGKKYHRNRLKFLKVHHLKPSFALMLPCCHWCTVNLWVDRLNISIAGLTLCLLELQRYSITHVKVLYTSPFMYCLQVIFHPVQTSHSIVMATVHVAVSFPQKWTDRDLCTRRAILLPFRSTTLPCCS